jgi:hypothetical protein
MLNPFDDDSSCEPSVDEFDSSMPICFDEAAQKAKYDNYSELSSPIAIIDLDRLSEKVSNPDVGETELRQSLQQVQQMLREIKSYSESLEQRNLEMVLDLERERMKNKQLLSALTFVKNSEEDRNQTLEAKIGENNDLCNRHMLERNRGEVLEGEAKTLRLENGYLKELILIANENYEKLEERNRELLNRCTALEEERSRREVEMLKKTEEIKNMFATIVVEKHQGERPGSKKEELLNTNGSINFSFKSVRKEPVEDAYRNIFMKTLRPRNR